MPENPLSNLIQFGIGQNGELQLVIAKEVWFALREGHAVEEGRNFVRISLSGIAGESIKSIDVVAKTDEPPCPPFNNG